MPDKPAAWDVAAPPRAALCDLSKAQRVPPRLGDARGLMTLNPKLLDIRVVKGWATGSRQLGGARRVSWGVSHTQRSAPPQSSTNPKP